MKMTLIFYFSMHVKVFELRFSERSGKNNRLVAKNPYLRGLFEVSSGFDRIWCGANLQKFIKLVECL